MPRPARRLAGVALIVAALALGAHLARRPAPPPAAGAPRALLLVTLDTTRADRLEPYGGPLPTPALARLARAGVTFERAYSVAPITLVAHATMLTGLYPPQHGVRNNGIHHLPEDVPTLATTLAARGWSTAAFVSAAVLERRYGLARGFEVYDDDLSAGRERRPRMVPDRPAGATVDSAAAWLDARPPEEPFFLWVHLYDPHAPYSPPPPWRDQHRESPYDGEIAYLDAELGRLLTHRRLAEALVAVVGDHGESLGEHGEQTHGLLASDATLHVPFLLAGPAVPAGLRVTAPVDQADLLPTLLAMLGLPPGDGPGRSLAPLLAGEPLAPRPLYAETYLPHYTYGWAKVKALRGGRWKYLESAGPELYDVVRDPRELSDLHRQEPGLTHDLGRDLHRLLAALGEPERETPLALDQEAAERLRSLGYLGGAANPRRAAPPAPRDMVEVHVALERVRGLLGDRLWDEAERQLRAVLASDPGNVAAWLELAAAHEGRGDLAGAAEALGRALGLDPSSPRLLTRLAAVEVARGQADEALALLDLAREQDPLFVEAYVQQAWVLAARGRRADAAAALAAAEKVSPGDARLEVARAQVLDLPAGDLPAAADRLRAALARDPFLVAGWRLLGEVHQRAGNDEEALAAWREGLRRAPDDADLHARLGLHLAARSSADAEAHLTEALRLAPRAVPALHVALGGVRAAAGRPSEALASYDRALAIAPGDPAARNNRALALLRLGRRQEARDELEALADGPAPHPDAVVNLAALAVEEEDWAAAERWARRATRLLPQAAEAWNNLGLALENTGRGGAARTAYERAVELAPADWAARYNLALLDLAEGRLAEAEAGLRAVVAGDAQAPEAHLHLGRLYAEPLARPGAARQHLGAFLRQAPAHPEAATARALIERLPPGR